MDGTQKWGNWRGFNKEILTKLWAGLREINKVWYRTYWAGKSWDPFCLIWVWVVIRSWRERAVVVGRSYRRWPVALGREFLLLSTLSSKGKTWEGEAAMLSGLGSSGKLAFHACAHCGPANPGNSHQYITPEVFQLYLDWSHPNC